MVVEFVVAPVFDPSGAVTVVLYSLVLNSTDTGVLCLVIIIVAHLLLPDL